MLRSRIAELLQLRSNQWTILDANPHRKELDAQFDGRIASRLKCDGSWMVEIPHDVPDFGGEGGGELAVVGGEGAVIMGKGVSWAKTMMPSIWPQGHLRAAGSVWQSACRAVAAVETPVRRIAS